MLNSIQISLVNASDVLEALGLCSDALAEVDHWTFGDCSYSLVGNRYYWSVLNEYYPEITEEMFFAVVPNDAYINLEG